MQELSLKILGIVISVLFTALLGRFGLGKIPASIGGGTLGVVVQEWLDSAQDLFLGDEKCTNCNPKPKSKPTLKSCYNCKGHGQIYCPACGGMGGYWYYSQYFSCGSCQGNGVLGCRVCSGSGQIQYSSCSGCAHGH